MNHYHPNGPNDPDFNCLYGAAIAANSGLAGYPAGTVNRATFNGITPQGNPGTTALSRGDWVAASANIMSQPSYVNVGVQASYDMSLAMANALFFSSPFFVSILAFRSCTTSILFSFKCSPGPTPETISN